MKNIVLTLLLILGPLTSLSAQSLTVQYKRTKNDSISSGLKEIKNEAQRKRIKTLLLKPNFYRLRYKDGASVFKENTDEINKDEVSNELQGSRIIFISSDSKGAGLYKNFRTNEFLNSTTILTKPFLITDVLNIPDWTITNEKKIIGNYKTKRATALIDGKKVTAWFADEIPITDGPADYYGLPGLILEAQDENNTYLATEISTKEKFKIIKPTEGKKVNRKDFKEMYDKKIKALKNSPSSFSF